MTRADRLAGALDDFLAVSPDVEGAAIVSPDGFPMASALPSHVEEDRLSAMSAALLILGERSASELGKGNLAQIFVEGPYGHVVIMAAGEAAVLVAVTAKSAKVGLVIFEMRQVARRVASIMGRPAAREPVAVDPGGSGVDAAEAGYAESGEAYHGAAATNQAETRDAAGNLIDIRDTEARPADSA
jgi:predicted regulator of Ras-like GTPase activity (Roadblock/LC7/MglB family)